MFDYIFDYIMWVFANFVKKDVKNCQFWGACTQNVERKKRPLLGFEFLSLFVSEPMYQRSLARAVSPSRKYIS